MASQAKREIEIMASSPAAGVPVAQTAEIENLPSLLGRLGEDVMTLVDTKMSLLKVEVKEDVSAYVHDGVFIAAGAVIALLGFTLLNIAVAFFISKLFTFSDERLNYAGGFLVTGAIYLIVGGLVFIWAKNRFTAIDPTPKQTLNEIKRDKQWLKKEV